MREKSLSFSLSRCKHTDIRDVCPEPVLANNHVPYGNSKAEGRCLFSSGTELDYEFVDYEKFHILRYEVGYAERWLQGLSNAAVKLNVPVQFCMSYPRYILETLRLPAVTNARASDDFNVDGPAYEYPVRKNGSAFLNACPEPVLANHPC